MTREILLGIVPTLAIAWYVAQEIANKKMLKYSTKTLLPDNGAYRTATIFKTSSPAIKGVIGVKVSQPMKLSTKTSIAIIWNSIFIASMVMTTGMFWGIMSTHLAFASVIAISILSGGSLLTSKTLIG